MDTVILGNGIVALATAFGLAGRSQAKDRITIVGKKDRVGSATLAAAAMLNSFTEIESGSLDAPVDLCRFELGRLAAGMWPKFERELIEASKACSSKGPKTNAGLPAGPFVEAGTYVINNTAADDLDDENYDAIVKALERFGEPFQHVSPRDIPNYMPEQRHRATRALLIANEGYLNPRVLIGLLDSILCNHPQVRFVEGNAERLTKTNSGISGVVLENGEVVAGDQFVLATGATVSDLLGKSGLGIDVQRVFYGVGVSVEIQSPEFPHTKCIRTPNRGLACGVYSAPYLASPGIPSDHILLGASNFISPTPHFFGRITSIESLLKAGIEQINSNFYRADLIRVNVGWRPTSQDTYPLIGKTSIANLVIASGTKRDGILMAPLLSKTIVALLHGEPVDKRFAFFAPERKPIRSLTRAKAIEKSVRHLMSASYQHGFTPPKSRMVEQVRQMHRDTLERLHDQVGAHDWGIPSEMLDMYRHGHAVP